jgi:C4-dicarboxylate transporter, DctM subunit
VTPSLLLPLVLVFLAAGTPIFVALGLTAALLFWAEGQEMVGLAQVIVDQMNTIGLLAIPFFVMAATFMQRGGIAKALIDCAQAWVGSMRGGLAIVCVVATTVFAAICGSSVATALAMGTILVPAMIARRYERHFALGVVGASGTLGILIPPSLSMIVYAIIADQSVPRLFMAGVIPGLLQASLFAAWIMLYARRKNYPREARMPRDQFVRANVHALPALAVPVIVLGGIYSGIVTVAEAAALAAIVAVFVSVFVYRGCRARDVLPLLAESMKSSAVIMLIIASALAFGHWITSSGIAREIVNFVVAAEVSAWQFLLFINVVMLGLGMFLEVISIILITLPLILPILDALKIDPIHFAVVLTVNMEIALLTPPVGLNLFVLSSITNAPVAEAIRGVAPFIVLMLGLLALITYVPIVSTFLPSLVFGG